MGLTSEDFVSKFNVLSYGINSFSCGEKGLTHLNEVTHTLTSHVVKYILAISDFLI